MTASDRAKWLRLISEGHSPQLAALALKLPASVADEQKFQPAIKQAQSLATERLRQRVLALALGKEDLSALTKELERRELVADGEGITRVERIIINPPCPKCGTVQPLPSSGTIRKTNGQATE